MQTTRHPAIDRRTLLRTLLSLPPLWLLAACDEQPQVQAPQVTPQAKSHDVLVIGGGMAGLAAARDLHDAGADVLLIEARNRLGGRVYSSEMAGVPLDLGASWIHGVRGNPLSELVERFAVEVVPTDYESLQAYDVAGVPFSDQEHAAQIDGPLDELLEAADVERRRREAVGAPDSSLGTMFEAMLAERGLNPAQRRALDYAINSVIEHEYAADVDGLSLLHFDAGFGAFGGGDVLFPGGYGQLVAGLAEGLAVQLESPVAAIMDSGSEVSALLSDGRTLRGQRAIVALPLGVLQSGSPMFSPDLPQAKLAALTRLSSGVLNKLYLRFPQVFWDADVELLGYAGAQKGAWAEWLNLAYYNDEPILLAFNAAQYGRALEALSDVAQAGEAMAVLRMIYGNTIPEPTGILASRWAADPYAQGAYSFVPPGATPDDHRILAAPVGTRLFFAGEHTCAEHPSTVHGALLSGRRAAVEMQATAALRRPNH